MDASEIHEPKIDTATSVFFFARTYGDDRSSAAAYERARAKISDKDNTSLFRVRAPDDGRQLLFVLCGTLANARRARDGLRGEVSSAAGVISSRILRWREDDPGLQVLRVEPIVQGHSESVIRRVGVCDSVGLST